MDRKSTLGDNSNKRSPNEDKTKEAALEKLRQMEWVRNKQDSWHLARSSSRNEGIQERKKYNNDQESYFEGTSTQKTKRNRKTRVETSQPTVPPGFTVTSGPSAPPPVNAWKQRKGSALFNKPDEVDEDDEMLKLALQESIKTAEEDEKRKLERMRLKNMDVISPSSSSNVKASSHSVEEEWDEDFAVKEISSKSQELYNPPKTDLHFVDTDSTDDTPAPIQRNKSAPLKYKKSNPHERFNTPSVDSNNYETYEMSHSQRKISPREMVDKSFEKRDNQTHSSLRGRKYHEDDMFEPSRPQEKVLDSSKFENHPSSSYNQPTSKLQANKVVLIPEKDVNSSGNDCAPYKSSAITFGDTQGLLDQYELKSSESFPTYEMNRSSNAQLDTLKISDSKPQPHSQPIDSDTYNTDVMLHNFIRHEPPSVVSQENVTQKVESSERLFPLNDLKHSVPSELLHNEQQNSVVNGLNVGIIGLPPNCTNNVCQDSGSSVSTSPLPNVTPYGSLEKQLSPDLVGGFNIPQPSHQYPFQFPVGIQVNQDAITNYQTLQLAHRNLATQMALSNLPQGYVSANQTRSVHPMGLPSFGLPNTNTLVNHAQNPGVSPQVYQAQLQHMMAMNALQQYQQAQLAAFNVQESTESVQKEQTSVSNQSVVQQQNPLHNQLHMVPSQSQTHMLLTQNPTPIPLQNHLHVTPQLLTTQNQQVSPQQQPHTLHHDNQSQMSPALEQVQTKQDGGFHIDCQQQAGPNPQNQPPTDVKCKDDTLYLQYQQALQTINQLVQQLAETRLQPNPIQISQPQNFNPLTMGMMGYPGLAMMPNLNPQLNSSIPIIPNAQHSFPGLSLEQNVTLESNTTHEPAQTLADPRVGRGRGRLH